ncbi:MAG: ABC transporter permease [Deltaproteobacteria bacterium]|nr:ABC transporter permease [Deltaproteobacteria bacterium]
MFGRFFRMPRRFLRGSYARLTLTVLALACGVAQVTADDLAGRETLRAFVEIIDTVAGRAALQVSAGEGALFAEDVAKTIAAVPGVELVVPVVSSTAFMADGSGELLTVQGMDIANKKAAAVYELSDEERGLDDPKLFLADAIVIPHAFADRRGIKLGDSFNIDTPGGQHHVSVRGMLDPHGLARVYGGNLLLMDLGNAQDMFGRAGFVNRVDVVVERDGDVQRVADAIAAVLPQGLHVERPSQRKADLQTVMRAFQVLLWALGLLGLVGSFLIAFNSLATLFEGRAWQLGVLRAIGVRPRVMWQELLKESVLLGAAGVVVGIPLGIGLAVMLLPMITTAAALNSKLATPHAQLIVQPASLALAAGLGLGAALLAAALPAWRATRVGMAQTMRGRGVEQQGISATSRWAIRAAVAVAIGVTVLLQSATGVAIWGLVATGLIAVGTSLAARPLLDLIRRPLLTGFRLLAGPTGELAIKNITQNPRRAALTVAMLGVGLAVVFWLWMVAHSFQSSVVDAVSGAMRADLVVSSSHIESGFLEAPVSDELVSELKQIAGTIEAVGERGADWQFGGGPITIDAYDPAYFTSPEFGQWPLMGRGLPDLWQIVARGEGAVVSSNFARNLHVQVGDTITLDSPSGPLALQVVGVVTHFASPRGTVEMSRDVYKRMWRDGKITRAFVRTDPKADMAAVRAAIAQRLGRTYNLRILSAAEIVEYFASQVRRGFAGVYILAVLVLSVVLVGMADTLAAGVIERTREIGAVRVVGVRRRYVRRMVLMEGLVLGIVGLALAAVAGLALGTLWVDATFPALLGWVLELHVPYEQAGVVILLTVAVCVLAALAPARRAAALEPAVALRYE